MEAFLFLVYLLFFIWLVNKTPFFKKSGLTPFLLITFFLVKVFAGVYFGYFYTTIPDYENHADTWKFFFDSQLQTSLIFNNPIKFITELIENPYDKDYRHFFSSHNSFWNDLRHMYMVKLIAIMNVFSGSRYYVNVVFYEFITFFGPVAFIRIMKNVFKGKLAIIAGTTFLIPSFIFWTSGIHKDGIVFTAICLIAYHFNAYLNNGKLLKSILYAIVLLLIIFPLRNYVVMAVTPALLAWWWSAKLKRNNWLPFVVVCIAGGTLFFTAKFLHPKINLPLAVVLRNKDFMDLGGKSILPQPALESNLNSFIKNAPAALNHALARPYLSESNSITYFMSAAEIMIMWLILFIWFFRYEENPYRHSIVSFFLMISIILLLLTGYIVPQLGAIVRYRSIYLPFLVVPLMCSIRWRKHIK